MASFSDLRKKANPSTETPKNLSESSLIYNEISVLQDRLATNTTNAINTDDIEILKLESEIEQLQQEIDTEEIALVHEDCSCDAIIPIIAESLNKDITLNYKLSDGNIIKITPEIAKSLSFVHDELNEESRDKMKILLNDSEDSFNLMVYFSESYSAL